MFEGAGKLVDLCLGTKPFRDIRINENAAVVGMGRVDGATGQRAPKDAAVAMAQFDFLTE